MIKDIKKTLGATAYLLEDVLAFLYATGDRKSVNSGTDENICPTCGADLEYDEETGEVRCPECDT